MVSAAEQVLVISALALHPVALPENEGAKLGTMENKPQHEDNAVLPATVRLLTLVSALKPETLVSLAFPLNIKVLAKRGERIKSR